MPPTTGGRTIGTMQMVRIAPRPFTCARAKNHASQLLGGRGVRFWHDQLFCKPAHHGGVVAWHQDYSYWTRTVEMQHLTCWCGLDDATEENGCLQYVPGSHRWGLLEKPALAGAMDGLLGMLSSAISIGSDCACALGMDSMVIEKRRKIVHNRIVQV